MAWKKIDDAQALADMPYSSFLANGLTTNANSYNNDMTRGGGIAWNQHDPVTWSSYWHAQGVMFTVNVGQSVTQLDFRVTYATLTNSVDADGFQGYVVVQHITGSEFVRVGLLPSAATPTYLDITLPLNAAATGPQAFSLTFQSSKLKDLGLVYVQGGIENIMYLDPVGGGFEYPITQGEKNILLDLTNTRPPSSDTDSYENEYQVNFIEIGGFNAGYGQASVYPALIRNPPRLLSYYESLKNGDDATVYELGAMTLLGIAFNSVDANPGNAPPQLSHQTAAPLSTVINLQNISRYQFQPDLCNGLSQRYALGAVIAAASTSPVRSAVKTGFSFVSNTAVERLMLSVTMRLFGLRTGTDTILRLTLKDKTGTLVKQVDTAITVARETVPSSVSGMTARGFYDPVAVAAWGMRDSMTQGEMLSGQTVAINVLGFVLQKDEVYTVELSLSPTNTAIYVYNLYARITTPIGSEG